MTKTIRIENADTANYQVKVITQDKVMVQDKDTGEWLFTGEWKNVKEEVLAYPTQMTSPYITNSRRIVIEESTTNA